MQVLVNLHVSIDNCYINRYTLRVYTIRFCLQLQLAKVDNTAQPHGHISRYTIIEFPKQQNQQSIDNLSTAQTQE